VRGKVAVRGKKKRADFLLFFQSNLPLAVVEAKDNNQPMGGGMQQALAYAETLDVPFVFSSNGDGFLFHDRTGRSTPVERTLALDEFPSPDDLWARYRAWKGITNETDKLVRFPYYEDASGRELRYYGS
jgi:type I restriction enzyme R subunit